jgi:hypothetical protein
MVLLPQERSSSFVLSGMVTTLAEEAGEAGSIPVE